jgi:hypothetical protein
MTLCCCSVLTTLHDIYDLRYDDENMTTRTSQHEIFLGFACICFLFFESIDIAICVLDVLLLYDNKINPIYDSVSSPLPPNSPQSPSHRHLPKLRLSLPPPPPPFLPFLPLSTRTPRGIPPRGLHPLPHAGIKERLRRLRQVHLDGMRF